MNFDVQQALDAGVVLLTGSEPALQIEALTALVAAATEGDEFALDTFMADTSKPLDWIAAASTAPFLSARRVALVRQVLRNESFDELVCQLPETALIILMADEEPGDDPDRARRFARNATQWGKAVEKAGGRVFSFSVDPKTVVSLLREEAKRAGKELTLPAANLLKNMGGDSLSYAKGELQKILLFAEDRPRIVEEDVQAVTVPNKDWSVFEMIDRLLTGETHAAMRQMQILLGGPSRVERAAFMSILPMLSRSFRLVFQARVILDAGGSPSEVPRAAKEILPERGNLQQEKDWSRRKSFQQAQNLSLTQIAQCLQVVAKTDARLKGQEAAFNAGDTLERMVLEIAEIVRPRLRAGARG